jgi:hypothetical protein
VGWKEDFHDLPFRGTLAEVIAWAGLFLAAIGKVAIGRDRAVFILIAIVAGPIAGIRFDHWREKKRKRARKRPPKTSD